MMQKEKNFRSSIYFLALSVFQKYCLLATLIFLVALVSNIDKTGCKTACELGGKNRVTAVVKLQVNIDSTYIHRITGCLGLEGTFVGHL